MDKIHGCGPNEVRRVRVPFFRLQSVIAVPVEAAISHMRCVILAAQVVAVRFVVTAVHREELFFVKAKMPGPSHVGKAEPWQRRRTREQASDEESLWAPTKTVRRIPFSKVSGVVPSVLQVLGQKRFVFRPAATATGVTRVKAVSRRTEQYRTGESCTDFVARTGRRVIGWAESGYDGELQEPTATRRPEAKSQCFGVRSAERVARS